MKAIEDNVARFEQAHPNIKVKLVGDINDAKLGQALRAGGSNGPDVVSSFTTSNVGKFCSSGALADLKPFIEKSKLDLDKTFPKVLQQYTQFEGRRCALPLLSDAYGLYYNKDAFRKAGLDPRGPAEDLVPVRRGRQEADEGQGRLVRAARLHAELPRLRDRRRALHVAVEARRLLRR
ncbi:hypothetical protein STANM309S_05626 [Streptomyces tanashiensis]